MLHYCKKCGRIIERDLQSNKICDCCQSPVYPVPEKYWLDGLDFLIENKSKSVLWEELVKPSPEFDQYLFDHREEILSKKSAEFNRAMAIIDNVKAGKGVGKSTSITCPYCKSTNVSKISTLNRAISVGTFGLASNKIGKQWKCNNCKSNF